MTGRRVAYLTGHAPTQIHLTRRFAFDLELEHNRARELVVGRPTAFVGLKDVYRIPRSRWLIWGRRGQGW